jgi:hypothetical protein
MKKYILYFGGIIIALILLISCGQNDDKQKELELKERELALKEKELAFKEKESNNLKSDYQEITKNETAQEVKKLSPDTKTMTMTFEEYSEGDYPHLIFKDNSSGTEYDFRHISDNNLNGAPILIDDNDAAFGFMANPKYLKKVFIVEAQKKTVLDLDFEGNTIKSKDWVINSIKLK